MSVQSNGTGPSGRRAKRFLSPSEKYEIWLALMRGEETIAQAANRAGVDRSTVMKLRMVARQGALDALAQSKPGVRPGGGPDAELAAARAEIARLSEALKEMGRQVDAGGGKWALGLSGRVPLRVPAATKHELLKLIDQAMTGGWDHRRVCAYLELGESRAWRWRERRGAGTLEDLKPGLALHAITPAEQA